MGGREKRFTIKTWQLILILIPLCFLTATFLRLDHLKMSELRDAVLAADKSGDEKLLSDSLTSLRNFAFSHTVVNAVSDNGKTSLKLGTGPFYLEESYHRAANAAIEAAERELSSSSSSHGNIFEAASNVCKPLAKKYGWSWNSDGYINCMTGELAKYPTASELSTTLLANVPSTELYRYEYTSPLFSFTLSGIFIILCLLLIVVIFIRLLIWSLIKLILIFDKSK